MEAPLSKYNLQHVKMLLTAVDDLHMIKLKAGWFTLIKYNEQVADKNNQALRDELKEFSAETVI
jgi:hypothetical protein